MKKIAVVTPGGDAPGMNPAVRAVVREAILKGYEVMGIRRGFSGLIEDDLLEMHMRTVSGIINRGGTILKTKRCAEIRTKPGLDKAIRTLKKHGIQALVIIGGDGSLAAGQKISSYGIPVINIPASIDNDIFGTEETIGYDTALNTAVDAIDKIRDTATSHERIFIVEIMGREHGFLSLSVGLAAGAEFVIVPEKNISISTLVRQLKDEKRKGKTSLIIVYAEGCGKIAEFAAEVQKRCVTEVRVSSLGYIQRGGVPSARSRYLAGLFGSHAVRLLSDGKYNRLVAFSGGKICDLKFSEVAGREKAFNEELYKTARRLSS
ncbi:MAG TPA: ATP-dependent 6-phosphofructokinase [Elusimicrobia bacterium]|nr:MAG: ATP-dependent 6-phosphofructokinase [Elusimicrobia bacterium RIFOXYA12_FULL_49_49]OGS09283.1 MAG: ATP-dependent 6-phosphofructokinase [Elusimicrobia bacterium RIFOXYB1_FULL_48_9]OGS15240.1 MAG: ATP-dependent 6-phosphofructokinase [Elusimicrobia bacterium RIFOXYA2_FULL_47_53]OGS25950.1 MAG: ATP-dependent 6-phosphofructokinase [Elusimicrobia bacterium RIFOXYB12_FULL_50_12]OGS30291.1 MAG: ATP-dependent 6-phosphofructokinase [Elusimicrobia bacterium RIFOXYB2_FULL_46_23]HBU70408.1 ATP-depen